MKRLIILPVGGSEWRPQDAPAYLPRVDKVCEILARYSDPIILARQELPKVTKLCAAAVAAKTSISESQARNIHVLADVYALGIEGAENDATTVVVLLNQSRIFRELVRELEFWPRCLGATLVNWGSKYEDWKSVAAIVVERRQRSVEVVTLGL